MTPRTAIDLLRERIARFPRTALLNGPTPLERQQQLSARLGVELFVKRDDLTGIAFGGNKIRKLEFYFGKAQAEGADTVLITGAVQSNYTRAVAACAARLGMSCHVQLEERVSNVDGIYRRSGNVLIEGLLGAEIHSFPEGENEDGADRQLHVIAAELERSGQKPFVIPLSAANPPLGSLGYALAAIELIDQCAHIDVVLCASGSGQTHAGLLFGLRALGWQGQLIGICVRRAMALQRDRIKGHLEKIARMLEMPLPISDQDVIVLDELLAPGYGVMNDQVANAIRDSAHQDGLLLDPVYTGRAMAGLFRCIETGCIAQGSKVAFIHTGGLPALFGYESDLRRMILNKKHALSPAL
jgi:D-cysteine desulfhydrase family pyridoxal phosphate-dependent enzyme